MILSQLQEKKEKVILNLHFILQHQWSARKAVKNIKGCSNVTLSNHLKKWKDGTFNISSISSTNGRPLKRKRNEE